MALNQRKALTCSFRGSVGHVYRLKDVSTKSRSVNFSSAINDFATDLNFAHVGGTHCYDAGVNFNCCLLSIRRQ